MQADNFSEVTNGAVLKKTYSSPRLLEYGSLEKITHGGTGTGADTGGTGTHTMTCL